MMSDVPKPCPFTCKSDLQFTASVDVVDGFDHGFAIFCPSCGISMHDEYKCDLLDRWNKRLPTQGDL